MEEDKEWRVPKNKKELEDGLRVRYISPVSLLSNYDLIDYNRFKKDKKSPSELVERFGFEWKYGTIAISNKLKKVIVSTDKGGMFELNMIKSIECLFPKRKKSWKVSFRKI